MKIHLSMRFAKTFLKILIGRKEENGNKLYQNNKTYMLLNNE